MDDKSKFFPAAKNNKEGTILPKDKKPEEIEIDSSEIIESIYGEMETPIKRP